MVRLTRLGYRAVSADARNFDRSAQRITIMRSHAGRRWFLIAALITMIAITAYILWGGRDSRPNVVLIVLDTTRADRLSCMGYHRPTTPHIDRLAAEGVVYERAYTTDFWTLPAHASLFTGLYPSQSHATRQTQHLPQANLTLAERFKQIGYDTSAFCDNPWISKDRGFDQGFDRFYEAWRQTYDEPRPGLKRALGWLDQQPASGKPFFMFINFNDAHLPYQPLGDFFFQFIGPTRDKQRVLDLAGIHNGWAHLAGKQPLTATDYQILGELYDAEIAVCDDSVGQIVDRLRALKALDNTVVIVTSDHGENLGEHGRIDHIASMYETTLHVPLVIRYPARFDAGQRVGQLVSLVDIAPTILDVCGLGDDTGLLDPLMNSLANADRIDRPYLVAEDDPPRSDADGGYVKKNFPDFDTTEVDVRIRMIRNDRYKLIWRIGLGSELYDLHADPGELADISREQPQISEDLRNLLEQWMKRVPTGGAIPLLRSQDEKSLEILRSFGYIR